MQPANLLFAEILATGDELRSGALVDTNSAWIAESLRSIGVDVTRHQCVGDALQTLVEVLQEISYRCPVAVVTGGLGPTSDDRTAEAAALAAGVALEEHPAARQQVEGFFQRIGRPMSASNRKQALLPTTSTCIANPLGSAPGFALTLNGCCFFFLPGVPAEMQRMLTASVLPAIRQLPGCQEQIVQVCTLASFGLPESVVGERLEGFSDLFPDLELGFRSKFPEIQIRLYATGQQAASLTQRLEMAQTWVTERIGRHIFSARGESMEAVVGHLLKQQQATVAVAESCTGGLVAHLLTNVPGSSGWFLAGAVAYANSAKEKLLGVSSATLEQHGAVSEAVVAEMALGICHQTGATYGLATSGIAGPDGGTPDKPVGLVCLGLAGPNGLIRTRQLEYRFTSRAMNKALFAMAALDTLRRHLMSHEC